MKTSVVPMFPATVQAGLPAKSEGEVIADELSRAAELLCSLQSARYRELNSGDASKVMVELENFGAGRLRVIAQQLDKQLVPATKQEIAEELAVLIGAFPNAGKNDLAIFGRALADDVGSLQPSRITLQTACRQLRRSQEFVPTIAAVMERTRNVGEFYSLLRCELKNAEWNLNRLKERRDKLAEQEALPSRERELESIVRASLPKPYDPEPPRPRGSNGGHAARIAPDLAARKTRNEAKRVGGEQVQG
jgi:hypothetical protein